ncbi:hypothetical protein WMF31_35075 [Sorangium sp. So ce1036]|uniref:hypothetical protein n=1 Tax=Sorangium TaxID=39643 RepID=UPI0013ED7FF5|nr:hypothetical protein [Sorangium cellulosum]
MACSVLWNTDLPGAAGEIAPPAASIRAARALRDWSLVRAAAPRGEVLPRARRSRRRGGDRSGTHRSLPSSHSGRPDAAY